MSQNEQWITAGRIPVDISGVDPLDAGQIRYDPGVCRFRCLGWMNNPKAKGKAIDVGFTILSGPDGKDGNKNRKYRKTYNLENEQSAGFFKALIQRMAGDKALVRGEPNFDALAGVEFDAMLYERDATWTDKKTGQTKTGKNYEIDTTTIVNVKTGAAGRSPSGGGGFAPAT